MLLILILMTPRLGDWFRRGGLIQRNKPAETALQEEGLAIAAASAVRLQVCGLELRHIGSAHCWRLVCVTPENR